MSAGRRAEHELGRFEFAGVLTFTVFGDDPHDPRTVEVLLDDGIQAPYVILTVEAADYFAPPEPTWLEGWIAPRDPWAKTIYGSTIGIVRRARGWSDRA